jgi:outer membrane protein OmpA-like peptidoglycan-associated protein
MVTLLLTFFVLLLSLADVQDPELFNKGRDSFLESLKHFGLGMLLGQQAMLGFGEAKIRHLTSSRDDLSESRTIDEQRERIRQILGRISRSMVTLPSRIVAERTDFSVANIRFLSGNATLDEAAKKFLIQFCSDLQQPANSKAGTLYVLGLASDKTTEKKQWILSARRAQVVADFLQNTLSLRSGSDPSTSLRTGTAYNAFSLPLWRIYWWGAGPGGDWVSRDSPISGSSHVLIAVLRASD